VYKNGEWGGVVLEKWKSENEEFSELVEIMITLNDLSRTNSITFIEALEVYGITEADIKAVWGEYFSAKRG
jgi:hypothetical protein